MSKFDMVDYTNKVLKDITRAGAVKVKVESFLIENGKSFIPVRFGIDRIMLSQEEADNMAHDLNAELEDLERSKRLING